MNKIQSYIIIDNKKHILDIFKSKLRATILTGINGTSIGSAIRSYTNHAGIYDFSNNKYYKGTSGNRYNTSLPNGLFYVKWELYNNENNTNT